jgi:hypothetical protein
MLSYFLDFRIPGNTNLSVKLGVLIDEFIEFVNERC